MPLQIIDGNKVSLGRYDTSGGSYFFKGASRVQEIIGVVGETRGNAVPTDVLTFNS